MPFGYIGIIGSFISDIFLFETHLDTLSIIGMILASFCLFFKLFIEEKWIHSLYTHWSLYFKFIFTIIFYFFSTFEQFF